MRDNAKLNKKKKRVANSRNTQKGCLLSTQSFGSLLLVSVGVGSLPYLVGFAFGGTS